MYVLLSHLLVIYFDSDVMQVNSMYYLVSRVWLLKFRKLIDWSRQSAKYLPFTYIDVFWPLAFVPM